MDYGVFIEACEQKGLRLKFNEPMAKHNGFKTGGNADIFVTPESEEALSQLVKAANSLNIPVFILGKGSNLLVSDLGIEGVTVSLALMDEITADGNVITAKAGTSLTALCVEAANRGLSGLEFAYGIPGSVGGALYMNAGAYGGEMADVVTAAEYLTPEGELCSLKAEAMALGYRHSIFKENGGIITRVTFKLNPAEGTLIWDKMNTLMAKRREKQPLEYPSAGSTFKRPEGYFAGALIEENGLKGLSVGGAEVSRKHAGFVINKENATTKDILELMERVRKTVLENSGVSLESEVIFVGRKQ